ncbi:hypothetical protein F383_38673 [Gossypium arboreum]|uniref:Uncharacterized protein n=1 Tax=Gossypium arboreum TaxID=29729 RepID=A0A0B0NSG3_GOSAR|nr:hypothetical protein F383_38673 [Gossypium arboreum]
MRPIIQYT